jgi:hypothetical protein
MGKEIKVAVGPTPKKFLYKVERNPGDVEWDETAALVLVADDVEQAREVAEAYSIATWGDEDPQCWQDHELSKVFVIGSTTFFSSPTVVLVDFKRG